MGGQLGVLEGSTGDSLASVSLGRPKTRYSSTFQQQASLALWVCALLLAVLAGPMILGDVYVADDLGEFHLPLRAFYARQLAAGEAADWCPDLYCGFYLTGEGQVGVYHPLHWLLYSLLPLGLAFDLECWLSYPLMLAGMVMFLRRHRLRLAAALVGAMAFTFGSFNFLHFVHPNAVAVVAHLPWLLWGIDVLVRSDSPRRRWLAVAAVAGLTGSQWLLGYPQYVLFSLMVELGYVAWATATQWALHTPYEKRCEDAVSVCQANSRTAFARSVTSTFRWLLAVGIGTLIGGVQLLPTFDALQHSVRKSAGNGRIDPGWLAPLNLTQLVAPYAFTTRVVGQNTHELAMYVGAVPLVLAIWGVVVGLRQRRHRPLVMASVAAALFGLLWAFGIEGPFGWFQAHFPLVNKFRLPCRAIVVFQLATAVLAAVGYSILLRRPAKSASTADDLANVTPWLWLLIALAAISAIAAPLLWPQHRSGWPYLAVGPVLIAAAVALSQQAIRGAVWAHRALLLLTAVDLGVYGMSYAIVGRTQPLDEYIQATNAPPAAPNGRVALDLLAGTQAAPGEGGARVGNRILLRGWRRVDGYAGLEPARCLDYRSPLALQLAGASWAASPAEHDSRPLCVWEQLSGPQPRARVVAQAMVSSDPDSDLAKISIEKSALVAKELDLPNGIPGAVAALADRPGKLSFATDGPSRQLLVVNESYHPGWQAKVDGAPAAVWRVNGDFQGVVVPAGRHEIRLQFLPASLKYGRLASGCGLGLLVVTLLLASGQKPRVAMAD